MLKKREEMFEGLEMDPNPSSFLPLYFVSHNSTNCILATYFTIYILANYHPLLTENHTHIRNMRTQAVYCYCRKYVKSQKARGGTGTPVHTRHRHSVEYDEGTREVKTETRGGKPQVFFSLSCLFIG